jgi:hypothetical protein
MTQRFNTKVVVVVVVGVSGIGPSKTKSSCTRKGGFEAIEGVALSGPRY